MKTLKFPLFLLAASTACSMAAVVTFDGYTAEDPLNSYPGWSTSESNTTAKLVAWVEPVDDDMAGAIGGAYAEAASATFSATYDSSYYGSSISFSLDVLLADSTLDAPGRDTFGIVIESGSGSSLMTVVFSPTIDFGDGIARWEVGYSIGGDPVTYTTSSLRENLFYEIGFTVTGSDYTFSFGNSLGTESFTGTVAGYDSEEDGMGDISFTWTKAPTTPYGDNYMVFDNITVVPEPGTALLGGLAALFLFRRRR